MKITTNSTETLEWDLETCHADASIESKNGAHTFVSFKVDRNGPPDRFFVDIDHEGELRAIHKAIGDLIDHLDRKRGVGRIHIDTSNMIESLDLTTAKPYFDKLPSIEELDKKLSKQMKSGHDSIQ